MTASQSRRDFVKMAATGVLGVAVGAVAGNYYGSQTQPAETITETKTVTETQPPHISDYTVSLRAVAEAKGINIGSAVDALCLDTQHYGNAQIYANTLAREFNYVTPEYQMQWGEVHPGLNDWNFTLVDDIANFAINHQMKLRGHSLIWGYGSAIPLYLTPTISNDEFRQIVENHIKTLVGHYKGKIRAWDVVNEALDESGELSKTLFLEKMGKNYIADVFHMAHEADPSAILLYQEYGAEGLNPKSNGQYKLVKDLVKEGVPIDGVALQMHLAAIDQPPYIITMSKSSPNLTLQDISKNIARLTDLGLKVEIAEMDLQIRNLSGDLPERLKLQRKIYHDVIDTCLKQKGFTDITFWGVSDANSWVDNFFGPDDPLLFDDKYKPKPAYWGVLQALLESTV